MTDFLDAMVTTMQGSPLMSLVAAALLGAASVAMSPCHLAGIPLVIGVIQTQRTQASARRLALQFGLGVMVSFALVGGLTVAVGRIAGDLGRWSNLLGAALFLVFGLQLLDAISLPWFASLTTRAQGKTWSPALVGLLFGASLGPCSFSFMAPVLSLAGTLSHRAPLLALALVGVFVVAHTAVVVLAGMFGDATERYLHKRGAAQAVRGFRYATGGLLVLGGLYFLYIMR